VEFVAAVDHQPWGYDLFANPLCAEELASGSRLAAAFFLRPQLFCGNPPVPSPFFAQGKTVPDHLGGSRPDIIC